MNIRDAKLLARLVSLGFAWDDAAKLRRIQMTLHRWAELQCGDGNDHCSWSIERDETTGKPFRCVYPHNSTMTRYSIADREKGALKRLQAILAAYPEWTYYHQTDLNGCAIDQVYTRGVAVCS